MTLTDTRRAGLAAIGLTFAALFIANIVGNGADENGGPGWLALTFAVCTGIAVWLFWGAMPRAVEAGPATASGRALIISVLSAVTFPVFWSGLPYVLAPAGIALGLAARSRGGGSKATLAVVIGAVALIAAIGVLIGDELDAI